MGNVHSIVQIAPLVSIEGAAIRVRGGSEAAFEAAFRAAKLPSYVGIERQTPEFYIYNVNVGEQRVRDDGKAIVYLVLKGGGKWGYQDEFRAFLTAMARYLEDARFLLGDEYTAYIDDYVLANGGFTVERVVAADGAIVDHAEAQLRADPARSYTFAMQHAAGWSELSEPAGAMPWIDKAIVLRPTSWEAHHERASLLAGQGGHREAITSLEKARACLPPHTLKPWGDPKDLLHNVEPDPDETIATALKRIECTLGDCYAGLERMEEASAAYERSFSITPRRSNTAPMINLALLLMKQERYPEAERCLDRAMSLATGRRVIGAIYYNRACIAARRGASADALAALAVAIELAPSHKQIARQDDDLENIRAHDTFVRLVG